MINLSRHLLSLDPYKPGEQPKDRQYIKLNANENPYPPSPEVIKEAADFLQGHPMAASLYADPDSTLLRGEIAAMLCRTNGVLCKDAAKASAADKVKIDSGMVYCGNGSDEVLSLSFYAFFDDVIISPEHSYSFYPVYCGYYGIKQEKVPLMADLTLDIERMAKTAARLNASTILANPNAPTGIALKREEIKWMLDHSPRDKVFAVDEAYMDFGEESALPLLEEYENLAIVRTFSKSMCAAGMRIGYLAANKPLISAITTVKNSMNHFPVDAVAQVFGAASCRHASYYADCAKRIVKERESFEAFLAKHGWRAPRSRANFVFACKKGVSGKASYEAIKKAGILVRRFDTQGIEDYLRITIGTHEDMAALEKVMEVI